MVIGKFRWIYRQGNTPDIHDIIIGHNCWLCNGVASYLAPAVVV